MPMIQVPYGPHAKVTRYAPSAGAEHFKTYSWSAPRQTHWRKATCEEYECDGYVYGFVTTVDLSTDLGQKQYEFITHDKTRGWHMERVGTTLVKFYCGPGNRCVNWDKHRVPIGRLPFLLVAGGDFRGNPHRIPTIRHRSYDDWTDDFANHQIRLKERVERG
jgi:hypothetical protein